MNIWCAIIYIFRAQMVIKKKTYRPLAFSSKYRYVRRTDQLMQSSPMTVEPTDFMTGMLSPVMRDSSQVDRPEKTFPSTGTLDPGTTFSRSPATSLQFGTGTFNISFRVIRIHYNADPDPGLH